MEFKHKSDMIYLEDEDGRVVAWVEFPVRPDGTFIITHTVVDPSLRGKGVAGTLIKALADKLRAEGHKASASCSYAVKWFDEHPEYSDVYIVE
ncbi:MAG: GNAT family N-acetyltransferase [Eubacteriales bacterium]